MSFWENKKEKPRIKCNGFLFKINVRKSDRIYWICSLRKRFKCKASAQTDPYFPNFAKINNPVHNHSHLAYAELAELTPIMDKIKVESNYFDDN